MKSAGEVERRSSSAAGLVRGRAGGGAEVSWGARLAVLSATATSSWAEVLPAGRNSARKLDGSRKTPFTTSAAGAGTFALDLVLVTSASVSATPIHSTRPRPSEPCVRSGWLGGRDWGRQRARPSSSTDRRAVSLAHSDGVLSSLGTLTLDVYMCGRSRGRERTRALCRWAGWDGHRSFLDRVLWPSSIRVSTLPTTARPPSISRALIQPTV